LLLTCRVNSYAFDIVTRHGEPFLTNRRLFAFTDNGIPDGIKIDVDGNVYSGCGDGIHVWSPGGVFLGKMVIPGGVANFVFCEPGEIIALNENRLYRIKISPSRVGVLVEV
jgi:gluconolactonase